MSVLVEGVEALVTAIADGVVKVDLSKDTRRDNLRYAPSFIAGRVPVVGTRPYSVDSLALFLGETKKDGHANKAIRTVVNALDCAEQKIPGGLTQK